MKNLFLTILMVVSAYGYSQTKNKTENVVLVTLDGFRWQEVFNGADSVLMKQQQHMKDNNLKSKYWRDDVSERRKALLPFFWNTMATDGQLYGNRPLGSKVNVTNQMWFSYPGYNEILTGHADDERINSNDKNYNPNKNVLEFINSQPDFKGKVAAFTSWDCFPYIINDKRSGVFVSAGLTEAKGDKLTERERMLNQTLNAIPNPLGDVRLDAYTFYYGMEYMKKNKPRVMYFSFDETDDFAHGGEYAAYLNAANYTDRFIGELWNYLQTDPQYKDKTTMIVTCDHGRGITEEEWKHHGKKIEHASEIWFAVIGPDTVPVGEMKGESQHYQNQIAKTIAALLDMDYTNGSHVGDTLTSAIRK
ncbi:MAG TPA: alkaline phosphatase family protein [Cyclobacteriaceae bacterium]|nr:alkaline phosphatase family protein [Cyclobacteriaceae bacterium]